MANTHRTTANMALWLLLLSLAAAAGCATDASPEALSLRGNVVVIRLPGASAGVSGQCYADQAEYMRPNGTIDLMLNNKYDFFPRLRNLLKTTETISGNQVAQLRADASMITITGAQVKMTLDTGKDSLLKGSTDLKKVLGIEDTDEGWYTPFVATIDAGEEVFSRFEAIPRNVGNMMRVQWNKAAADKKYSTIETVTVYVAVEGFMQDGTVVRSQTVPYPVQVCWGCLVFLPQVAPGFGQTREEMYQFCNSGNVPSDYAAPCVMGNDEFVPCPFYCSVCKQNGDDPPENACDDTFCPAAP